MASMDTVRSDPRYLAELERQLEVKEESLKKLNELLAQKEDLLLATSEKLCQSEKRKVELEESSFSSPKIPDGEKVEDNFVCSNWRAARLETENNALKSRLVELANEIEKVEKEEEKSSIESRLKELSQLSSEILHSFGLKNFKPNSLSSQLCGAIVTPTVLDPEAIKVLTAENVQLHVRMELEHERRVRTQLALDEAERNFCSARREAENRTRDLEELQASTIVLKEKFEKKVKILGDENRRLRACVKEKEAQIMEIEARAKSLSLKAEEFEEMFNIQLETVKALQSDLTVASSENQVLVHEMETLSKMFNAMEQRYVSYALDEYKDSNPASAEDGTSLVEDVLKADDADSKVSSLQESCFKEVTTKNGTRMVLSVSKTFMKLKDLIMEKKSLEDRVEKMKAINTQLVSRVNLHEAKLYNITDELNKTWTYVSTLKLQHKQLHTSEQILRAELAEKRELLAKLREELEISRESWILVKKKTADSEREWRALRDEFAERRRLFPTTSSESGFSDAQTEEEEENDDQSIISEVTDDKSESNPIESPDQSESNLIEKLDQPGLIQICDENEMSASTLTIKAVEESNCDDDNNLSADNNVASDESVLSIPIFIPSLDYVAGVPPEFLPPLFPTDDPILRLGLDSGARGSENDVTAGVVVDENYEELYSKLIASTARSAALANRLAEIHRNLTSRDESDIDGCGDGDDDDVEPRTEEEDDAESSDLHSESELAAPDADEEPPISDDEPDHQGEIHEIGYEDSGAETDSDSSDLELEDLGLSPEAIERALASAPTNRRFSENSEDDDEEDSDTASATSVNFGARGSSSTAPEESEPEEAATGDVFVPITPLLRSQESTSYVVPVATVAPMPTSSRTARPDYANQDSIDDSSDEDDDEDGDLASENATAVTRFLIKTFPKQLSKLRNEKTELEERIQDLEARISEQNSVLAEMERRTEIYRKEAETARKWTSSIGAINFGKSSDDGHHHCCSCSRLTEAQKSETPTLAKTRGECPENGIRSFVDVTNPGEIINWTICHDIQDISASVFYQSSSGELSEEIFDIIEDYTQATDEEKSTNDVTQGTVDNVTKESTNNVTQDQADDVTQVPINNVTQNKKSKVTQETVDDVTNDVTQVTTSDVTQKPINDVKQESTNSCVTQERRTKITRVKVSNPKQGQYMLQVVPNNAAKQITLSDIFVDVHKEEK